MVTNIVIGDNAVPVPRRQRLLLLFLFGILLFATPENSENSRHGITFLQ